jgi:hypothetical protein
VTRRSTKKVPANDSEPLLALKTVSAEMCAHGGFLWPESGHIEAPDWDARPRCGGGLHALPWGIGDGSLLNWDAEAKWLVMEVDKAAGVVDLDGKIKFRACDVLHCGDQKSATDFLFTHKAGLLGVVGAFVSAPASGGAHAGYRGTATAGEGGTATAGEGGTATAGDYGTATAGYRGTATAGEGGTATAGEGGTLVIRWWDGKRYRFSIGYVNESGIESNTPYRLTDKGVFVKAESEEEQAA